MSIVDAVVSPRASVGVSRQLAELSGTTAPGDVVPAADRLERARGFVAERPAPRVVPTAPEATRAKPRGAAFPGLRADLQALRRQPNGEMAYQRAIEEIAADIRGKCRDRITYTRDILESLRDPEAYDGRGEMAADVYQRIEPASPHTPPAEREGRLTADEKAQLVEPAPVQEAARPGVGGPDWTRALSSFNNVRIDVELPRGASDYMSYKPYRFGTARTIESIKRIAERYRGASGMMLRVGDIAKRGGGQIPDHSSHRDGKIFDLDLAFNDGRTTAEPDRDSVNATWRSPAYDRANTRRLILAIKAIRPEAQILFNDPVLVREGLVRSFPNHDNHMHVQRLC